MISDVLPASPAMPPADDRLADLIDTVGRLAEQQRSLIEAFRTPAPQPPPAAPAATSSHAGDLRGLIAGLFKEHQASAMRSAARQAYLHDRMSDLPSAYQRLLPETDDNTALVSSEQEIRRQFREDLKTTLRTAGDPAQAISGDARGGAPPAAAVDYARLSPLQQIAVGLRSATSTRIVSAADAAGPAAAPQAARPPAQTDPDDAELFVGAD